MNEKVNELLKALRGLTRAQSRLLRGVRDPRQAQTEVDAAMRRVLQILGDPILVRRLEELIPPARDRLLDPSGKFDAELSSNFEELIKVETRMLYRLETKTEEVTEIFVRFKKTTRTDSTLPKEPSAISDLLLNVQRGSAIQVTQTRALGRKEKKKRKRKIGQAVVSAVAGVGIIVTNVTVPSLFPNSFGAGSSALIQALRDVVGEPAD